MEEGLRVLEEAELDEIKRDILRALSKANNPLFKKLSENQKLKTLDPSSEKDMKELTTLKHNTDLALSISYGIIEQHGGRIEVDSQVKEGANFKIYLPLKTENKNESPVS